MTVKPQRGSALCLRLALRKNKSMTCEVKKNNGTERLWGPTCSETHDTSQTASLSPTDGASMGEERKWVEAVGFRMGE